VARLVVSTTYAREKSPANRAAVRLSVETTANSTERPRSRRALLGLGPGIRTSKPMAMAAHNVPDPIVAALTGES
jgi:hypothetical protein